MKLRKSCLPPGWYPRDSSKITEFIRNNTAFYSNKEKILAAVAPHAGWYYSGSLAARSVAALKGAGEEAVKPCTVAVIGGHLPGGMPALFANEDAVETPLGNMEIDLDLQSAFLDALQIEAPGLKTGEDRFRDNTVEVLLPMVKYFFPDAKLLWLRLPADVLSFEAGKILARVGASSDRRLLVLGSTDLTHYGTNYGFSPRGSGKKALDWVKTVNDRRFIDAVESGNHGAVLELAENEHSSCSAGAILGVMGFAAETRARIGNTETSSAGRLLAYGTSADIILDDEEEEEESIPDSFVGYGAFVWD
jgi:AmmeMemoRadiSam system protein B